MFFFFPDTGIAGSEQKVIAIIAVAAGQRICFANRALIMPVHMHQHNRGVTENALRLHQGYFFIEEPSQPPSSMLQAIPKCTSNPPQMLRVL